MNPLKTIKGTILSGVVVAVIVAYAVNMGFTFNALTFTRWIHVLAGVTWIGLLYYFNFIQVPAVAEATADTGGPGAAAISKYVAPRALLWFRWSALLTWLSGAGYLGHSKQFVPAFMLQEGSVVIGLGAWMGTIMLFNVWVLIWPNQKKLLGIVEASDEEKARGKVIAFMASRTNTLLSIPMIMCMVSATHTSHGLPF